MNTHPLHFDNEHAAQSEFGRPLVNSCLTLAIVTGMSVSDVSQKAVANLGWSDVAAVGQAEGAGQRHGGEVVGRDVAVRAVLPEGADRAVDQPRVARRQRLPVETEALIEPGPDRKS